ncbi:ubiquitin domain-containing protein UBFD1-like [Dendronephthya gigantea]|uniref:ubiquitin domain-containing protein UBFD1-like n=1 Tax=Dendronephthya gigantea TaxID=151771 RepID=UPI00106D0673|nr:ubiquitin domain-containing protein UBFD1-like [Dendronephthya gigantea]
MDDGTHGAEEKQDQAMDQGKSHSSCVDKENESSEKEIIELTEGLANSTDVKVTNDDIRPCREEKETKCTENEKAGECLTEESTSLAKMISFRVVWNKKNYDVTFNSNDTVESLKKHIETLTGLPVSTQKLMYKGLVKDDSKTLNDIKLINNAKMMVIGSTVKDIMAVNIPPSAKALKEETAAAASSKEPWSQQKMHKKILDKGKPEDAMPGDKTKKEPLPRQPISGMLNKAAGKVRLTFKLEVDQLWIGTKERTEKISMGSIKNVLSEPIEGHEDYHVLAIQLGPTEASRYWVYWVPAQYVDAIKDTILGKWQPF